MALRPSTMDYLEAVSPLLPTGRSSPVVIGGFNLVRPGAPDVLVDAHAKT
jgi:hypothetical protein